MPSQNQNRQDGQVAREHGVAARPAQSPESGRALRIAALVAVAIGLAALTAAACVLSYDHIQHLALQSGVSTKLANVYPLIFDALLVLAGCSILALRGAGLGSRVYAWLCMLILLAGLAAGGAVHAAGVRFSRKGAGIAAAVLPWLLVLVGFGLLLALLRYARQRRQANRTSITEHPDEPLHDETPDAVLTGARTVLATARPAAAPAPAGPTPVPRPAPAPAPEPAHLPRQAQAPSPAPSAQAAQTPASAQAPPPSQAPPSAPIGSAAEAPSAPAAEPTDDPVQNPALAALAIAPSHGEPATAPQPAVADLAKPGQHKLPVRQADLQLRARIPRPAPASGGPPSAAAGARRAGSSQEGPFMPRVGAQQPGSVPEQPLPASEAPGHHPAGGPQAAPGTQPPGQTPPPTPTQPATAQPATAPRPAAASQSPDATEPTTPTRPASADSEPADTPAGTEPGARDSLNAAPTADADDDAEDAMPRGLPRFLRQRSSPTPPDEE